MAKHKIGVFLIGAYGGVSTTLLVGARAIARKIVDPIGLITEKEPFKSLRLVPVADLVFGGMDIRKSSLVASAKEVAKETGTFPPELLAKVIPDLRRFEKNVTPGTALECGEQIQKLVSAPLIEKKAKKTSAIVSILRKAIRNFAAREKVQTVIVVNLASTEPYVPVLPEYARSLAGLEKAIQKNVAIKASLLYAYAAVSEGCPFIHFTPSIGSSCPAIEELAEKTGAPFAGKDGKTGETLLKTTLGQMFVERAFKVMSWEGYNIFGDRDAVVLDDPRNNLAKTSDKDATLRKLLGDKDMHTRVRIDYVPSLSDWKTAWDFIHFRGFTGVPMRMHFIWEGCDAILAAPLVLDMIRLMEFFRRKGIKGNMTPLACFFKNPYLVEEQGFPAQFAVLRECVRKWGAKGAR